MKKAIALLLVLAVALGMGIVAFAATDYPPVGARSAAETDTGVIFFDEFGGTFSGPSLFSIRDPSTNDVTVPANELFLVDEKNGEVVGMEDVLLPNETYKFEVYHNSSPGSLSGSDAVVISGGDPLTRADIGSTGSVKFRTVRGSSAVQSARVRTRGSGTSQTYYVEITTRNLYGTKLNDVEYELSAIIGGTSPAPGLGSTAPASSVNYFKVGFLTITDAETDVGEEGTIVIYRETPIITKDQFSDIARSANYKNVIFEGEEGTWSFKGKVAGMRDTNFYYDFEPSTDLLNRFPEHEFKFLTFRSGVNFPTTGEMRIDVSDIADDFGDMHAYLFRENKLTEINSVHDISTDELVFRTNYLGHFIISNERITDTSLVPELEPEEEEEDEDIVPEPDYPLNTNPNTGAPASADAMVALGLISLATAAAIGRKRK